MKEIYRNHDVVSGIEDLEHLCTIKNMPVFMGCVDTPRSEDVTADAQYWISRGTGMIQLNPLLPLEVVYQSDHSPGNVGKEWLMHHEAFADFIVSYMPKRVFEIGGAHGLLSKYCHVRNPNIDWTILEPNPLPAEGVKAKFIKGFYTPDTELPEDVDMIVHSHTLEHVYHPHEFFMALAQIPVGVRMCFSIPNLRRQLDHKYTNVINFEHTYYCTEEFVDWWLEQYDFKTIYKRKYKGEHSMFYATERVAGPADRVYQAPPDCYERNKMQFIKYIKHHADEIKKLNTALAEATTPVFMFGAHIFSQFLISVGLDTSKVQCILDNSVAKQGKRLYGTDFQIASPEILRGIDRPVIVLKAGVYNHEIRTDIVKNINPTAIFLE